MELLFSKEVVMQLRSQGEGGMDWVKREEIAGTKVLQWGGGRCMARTRS